VGCPFETKGGFGPPLLFAALLLVAALAPATAAWSQESQPGPVAGGVYRRPLPNDPATLDPLRVSDTYGRSVAEQIFDGLVQFDQTLTVTPALARFWKASRDGLVWTFYLRQGVRFHHGRELTSEDVVYSLTRLLDPRVPFGSAELFTAIRGAREYREGRVGEISGLRALDRHTVEITLTEAFTPFVSLLAMGQTKIVPKDLVEQRGAAFGLQPVGSGPFTFGRWERGKEIVLTANPDYFGGPPRLSRVVYRIFPGESSDLMCQEFDQGRLEESPVPPLCRDKVADPRYQFVRRATFTVRFYGLNTRFRPLHDARVRQAIAHAVDREGILHQIFADRFQPALGIFPPGMPGYNRQVRATPYAPSRSRELLRLAGYPEGRGIPTIPIWSSVRSPRIERELDTVKSQLGGVGIRSEIKYDMDWPSFSKQLAEGRLPMFLYAWHADAPDPDSFLFPLFHSRSARNVTGYVNPAVDQLLIQARREHDVTRRIELYRRIEPILLEDAPVVPVWHYDFERLFQRYVRSVEVNGLGDPYIPLRKIWLEERR
jgi:oligopeptide transport system substrate-binding protein